MFLIKLFFYMTKKSRQKLKYLENEKSFKGERKAFFIIFKGLSLKQIKQIFLDGKGPTLNCPIFMLSRALRNWQFNYLVINHLKVEIRSLNYTDVYFSIFPYFQYFINVYRRFYCFVSSFYQSSCIVNQLSVRFCCFSSLIVEKTSESSYRNNGFK